MGLVEPVEHAEPAGQSEQSVASSRSGVLEYVPAKHGSSADAAGGQKYPGEHDLQAVAPLAFWYLPPRQSAHVAWLWLLVKVPAAQRE